MWARSVLSQAVLVWDYFLLSILLTMALCCTLAVVGSSCYGQAGARGHNDGRGANCLRTQSYVTREGGTRLVGEEREEVFTV